MMMRIVVATMIMPALAAADPVDGRAGNTPADASTSYARAGTLFGFDADWPAISLAIDGGYRIHDGGNWTLWARALAAIGGQEAGDMRLNDHYAQLRGGAEARACTVTGLLCGVIGADAGYRWLQTMGDSGQRDGGIVVPRAGFDVGGQHLRVGIVIEDIIDRTGQDGGEGELSAAVRW